MNIISLLFLLVMVSVIEVTCQQDLRCNDTVTSMEKMLDKTSQFGIGPNYVVCVNISNKKEVLRYNNVAVPFSVVIRPGVGLERCTLTCERNQNLPLSNYERFPLIIRGSNSIHIENIDFVDCVRPVQMLWIKEINIINTIFRDFSQGGALEISNSPLILVDSCQFTNNTSEGIGATRYSGNSGGLSIGFDDNNTRPNYTTPQINITSSTFTENRANAGGEFKYNVSYVLKTNIFNQRGGALAIYIGTANYSACIRIHNCTVQRNRAQDSGGGVYMNIGGDNNAHQVTITDSQFLENNGPDGGGLEITQYSSVNPNGPHHTVNIFNTLFEGNVGIFGGGYKSIQLFVYLNSVNLYNCTFINNTALVGAALYLQSVYTVAVSTVQEVSTVQDCVFENNNGNRGTLFVIQNSVGIRGFTVFRNNTGPALRILHCLVSLGGDIWFIGNRAHPEGFSGALYFSQYGQVLLKSSVNITFINNTGNEGACIVVKNQLISAGFPQQLYNPQCFLQYEEPTLPTQQWNVTMLFEGNRALLGPVVYTSDLDPCQWYNESEPFFSLNSNTIWGFMDMRDNYINRGGVEDTSREDYVQTDIHFLEIPDRTNVTAPPGSLVTLNVIALDQERRNTSAFLELLNDADVDDNVVFEPTVVQTIAGVGQISFKYSSFNRTENSEKSDMIIKASFLSTENIPSVNLTLVHELCLPGYIYRDQRCECISGTSTVLYCLPDERGILLADGLWGAPPNWSRTLVTHTCPSGYCNCFGDIDFQESEGCPLLYKTPNKICDNTRQGLLCGQCKMGMGVGLLTNMCRKYTNAIAQAYWLLPIYLVLLVVGLVLIVRLGLHLPTIFRGFLFYIQVSSVAAAYIPATFSLNTNVMDCIWSATSLYVPYDFSFHAGLTSLESYGLRYLTPLIALIVVPIAARVRTHSKYWHGVWTVILLLYTRAVDTSISLLHCPTFTGKPDSENVDIATLWFFDGTVRCFQGAHAFLGIVSIFALLALIMLIPLTALIIYHRKIKRTYPPPERVEKLTVAITKGFKENYKWWPVMELSCRFIFITVVSLTPSSTFVPLIFSLILLVLQMATQPYEKELANAVETFALLWLVVLLALGNTTPVIIASKNLENFTLWPVFFLPVAVGGVVIITYIAYKIRLWYRSRRRSINRRLRGFRQGRSQRLGASASVRRHNFMKAHNATSSIVSFDNADDDYELVDASMLPTESQSVIN